MPLHKLSTEPYKGTRDFYPEDMAVQQYIFDRWAKTAESFGYERYDASILEPAELYKSKGAENEEMVNEQTYTFIDRGERAVTLRPEMTPTVARMIAGRRRELSFPARWYSIPNLFRYERPQRGRLREHWQLNCDIFGSTEIAADIETIALAYHTLIAFGATPDMFEIRISDRAWLNAYLASFGLADQNLQDMINLIDRKEKIPDFEEQASALVKNFTLPKDVPQESTIGTILHGLENLGIQNVVFSPTIVRGFNYYTSTVFEVFDTSRENNRSLIGGGRYDNLTALFGGEPISGVGFGMGDVTMRDFLELHNLLPAEVRTTAPLVLVIPTDSAFNEKALVIAQTLRGHGRTVAVDFGDRKIGRKISAASDRGVRYVLVVGENEVSSNQYALKELSTEREINGTLAELATLV